MRVEWREGLLTRRFVSFVVKLTDTTPTADQWFSNGAPGTAEVLLAQVCFLNFVTITHILLHNAR